MCAWGPGLLAAASGWTDGDGHLKGSVLQRQGVQSLLHLLLTERRTRGPQEGAEAEAMFTTPTALKGGPISRPRHTS